MRSIVSYPASFPSSLRLGSKGVEEPAVGSEGAGPSAEVSDHVRQGNSEPEGEIHVVQVQCELDQDHKELLFRRKGARALLLQLGSHGVEQGAEPVRRDVGVVSHPLLRGQAPMEEVLLHDWLLVRLSGLVHRHGRCAFHKGS